MADEAVSSSQSYLSVMLWMAGHSAPQLRRNSLNLDSFKTLADFMYIFLHEVFCFFILIGLNIGLSRNPNGPKHANRSELKVTVSLAK